MSVIKVSRVAVVIGALFLIALASLFASTPKSAQEPVAVDTVPLEISNRDLYVIQLQPWHEAVPVIGTIQAVRVVTLSAVRPSRVTKVLVREGDKISKGDLLAVLEPFEARSRIAIETENVARTQAQLKAAKLAHLNDQNLAQSGFISQRALDRSTADLGSADAEFNTARSRLQQAMTELDDGVTRAPLTGVVAEKLIQEGQSVQPGATLFSLIDPSRLEIKAAVPLDQLHSFDEKGKARFRTTSGLTIDSVKLRSVVPMSSSGARLSYAYFDVHGGQGLAAGMFVRGELVSAESDIGMAVPLTSIMNLEADNHAEVLVLRQDKLVRQKVTVGRKFEHKEQEYIRVMDGLATGERVVRQNLSGFPIGVHVRVIQDQGSP